ncbi:MAG: VWA domain-containing protein, partial [Anaerolineales bacterium]
MSFGFVRPEWLWFLAFIPLAIFLAWIGAYRQSGKRFWWGLALRSVIFTTLILALSGFQVRRTIDTVSTIFVVDISDSVLPEEQARAEDLVRQTVADMPSGDRAGVILFGQEALVERLVDEESTLAEFGSIPATSRTNLAAALQLAMAIMPEEGGRRIIILSDGRQNIGQAIQQAEFAAAHQIELSFIPLYAPEGEAEVLLQYLSAPTDARIGQSAQIEITVDSSISMGATLRLYAGDELLHASDVRLQQGLNHFQVAYAFSQAGFRRFRAEVTPDADTWLQNNQATAFTVVHGPPRILIVEGAEGEAAPLSQALEANEFSVDLVPVRSMPTALSELVDYDAVVLVNAAAEDLPAGVMETLGQYVRDLGKGLVTIGGDQAYGAGGYLRTPLEEILPVSMEVRNTEENPSMALVLVLDKSGSMGRCHCDNPDLDQTYVRAEVGQPKVDIAKSAVMRAASALGPSDILGVVAFDSLARWAVETGPVVDMTTLERSIGVIEAEGATNMRSGVEAAYDALLSIEARRKHIVLLTDGWVHTGDLN